MSTEIKILKSGDLGRKKEKKSFFPKGRIVDEKAEKEIISLLKNKSKSRDMLIENLHLIQDKYKCLHAKHLTALATIMKMPLTEVYEVASFYAHFDIIDNNEKPANITIRVCDTVTCEMFGAKKIIKNLKKKYNKKNIRILNAPCMGRCDTAPVLEIGHKHIDFANEKKVENAINKKNFSPKINKYIDFDDYKKDGGYKILKKCLSNKIKQNQIIKIIEDSKLKGLGGAGFPTGLKWKLTRNEPAPRLMAVNADEGEPGTFKDRYCMETDPHRFLEGTLIAAWVVEAKTCYIYLRDEYPFINKILKDEIKKIERSGLSKNCKLIIRRGAGAYICGEESAMLESIEGKRGYPRHKPPFPVQEGLFGRPTLCNNVETLFWIRDIIEKGSKWFSEFGKNGGLGFRFYSVSGRVKNPGVKKAPAGITVKELIDNYCGGMEDNHEFKGYLPGGASGGILPASLGNIPLDFGKELDKKGCFVGSAAIVIFSQKDNMKDITINLLKFFEDESCGQCTPCRVGTEKAVKLLKSKKWDKKLLNDLDKVMTDASICGLGQAASNPINCVLKYFQNDVS
tara:strand:- start:2366 stop:4069 length:1704 start_codon:yes stop_codon:yes gene_type:complete